MDARGKQLMREWWTLKLAKEANEAGDDYVYEDGCVKDLRSISDGGNGLLRGATVVALLEETGCASSLFPTSHAPSPPNNQPHLL